MNSRSRDSRRKPGNRPEPEPGQQATKEAVADLMQQLGYPGNRADVEDYAEVVPLLVREARRYGLPIPHWLARAAGFREPPPPLQLVLGGKRGEGIGGEHQTPRVR